MGKDDSIDNTSFARVFKKKEKGKKITMRKGTQREETMAWEPVKEKNRFHVILKVVLQDRKGNQAR